MDQRSDFIKDQKRRCSPRFKGASPRKTTKTKFFEQKQTSNTTKVSVAAVSTFDSTATLPLVLTFREADARTPEKQKQCSKPSTPASSSIQRELKKIEDYWTRQDPVKTDSPRLRYHKTRDGDNKDVRLKNDETPVSSTETAIDMQSNDCLPESPIPNGTIDEQHLVHERKDTEKSFIQKPNKVSREEDLSQDLEGEKRDDEDVGYLPPRKKLRSEVKQDELWEGFPLTVTFKRLTPRCKQIEIISKTVDDDEKTGSENGNDDSITNSKLVRNYDTTQDPVCHNGTVANITNQKAKCRNIFENMEIACTTKTTDSTATIPVLKRSARIQEKNNKTPIKNVDKSQLKANITAETLILRSKKSGIENLQCGKDVEAEITTNTAESLMKDKTENIDTKQNEGTLSCGKQLSASPNTNDCDRMHSQSECASLSISQILSCDSQVSLSDDVPEVADTVEIELESIGIHDENKTMENELKEIKLDCEKSSIDNGKFAEQDKQSSTEDSKSESLTEIPKTQTRPQVTFHDDPPPEEEDVQENEIKQSCKAKKDSCLFTIIRDNNSPKIKKVPPLKIKLKNTSKRHKCLRIKKKKDAKKLSSKTSTIAETSVTESAEPSESKEAKIGETITSKPKGKKKVTKASSSMKSKHVSDKKKQKKKSNKDQQKRSPPPNMNLRLNSERRLSMVNGLLSNNVLNNHACVIWSSENRRHMHLSYPDATHAELDDLLREKWSQLCEKEKIRYFQRAWNASKDENKHSSRRHACLQAEKQEQEQAETASNSKLKTLKKSKPKKQHRKVHATDTDAKHRRLMFEAILRYRQDILEIWADKKETQFQQLKENFDKLVKKLVVGGEVHLTRNVKSARLTQVLADLRELEKDKKLTVSGEVAQCSTYFHLLNEVDIYLEEKMRPSNLLDSLDSTYVDHDKVEQYLRGTNKLDEHKMPILNAVAIKHVLDDVSSQAGRRNNLSIYKKPEPLSPPSILTEWVAEDIIRIHPNLGFRSAVSLLSNKVHHNPAFVTPAMAEQAVVQTAPGGRRMHSILRANNNQNCYKTVTYTFARDKHSHPFISRLKTCGQNHVIGNGNN